MGLFVPEANPRLHSTNGFLRRDVFARAGTYTWTAPKEGDVKIQGLGAAAGASGTYQGASGCFGERTLHMKAGDQITIVVGQGGAGVTSGPAGNGTSSSISGTPVSGGPLVLTGATGANNTTSSFGAAGSATGPWDLSYDGAVSASPSRGSPASASPFGPGIAADGTGGAGWGGPSKGPGGASSHREGFVSGGGAPGLIAKGGVTLNTQPNADGEALPFWDLRDVDSGGGAVTGAAGGNGGPGAGGAAGTSNPGGVSALGGGTGLSATEANRSGFGAGGGATSSGNGGAGGNPLFLIFWDEVL